MYYWTGEWDCHLVNLGSLCQYVKEQKEGGGASNLLTRMIDPDSQGKIGLQLHKGAKKDYVWNSEDALGHLLVHPCPRLQKQNSDPLGMRVGYSNNKEGFPGGSVVKNPPAMRETWVQPLDQEDPLEKEMTTHSSILAWEIPWTEEAHEFDTT